MTNEEQKKKSHDNECGPGISAGDFKAAAERQLKDQDLSPDSIASADQSTNQPDFSKIPEGTFPEKIIYQALEENENGDAALMVELFQGKRLFDQRANPNSAWFYWNDHYWREDEQKEIFKLVQEVVAAYNEQRQRELLKLDAINESGLCGEDKDKQLKACKAKIKELKDREKQLQSLRRITNVVKLSSMGVKSLGYVGDGWDSNPWLLGCKNGVIDLKKGWCRSGQPGDYIKTICPIDWDGAATCPTWEKFLYEIFEGDRELIDFLQRLLGYVITGLREEHIYPILWGEHGRNGKGTILETLALILGPMAYKAPTQIVMQGLRSTGTGPNPVLMRFRGARLVWTSEANKKEHLDTAIVKGLTGGDTISARNAYDKKEANFTPTHTPFTLVNDLPRVDADDEAFWERVILIPFRLSFVSKPSPKKAYQKKKNPKLGEELAKELPGILRWLVEGTQMWIEQGLNVPNRLRIAKKEYRQNEDILRLFLNECCFIEEGNTELKTKPKELFKTYQTWCTETGFNAMNQKHFHEAIKKKIEPPSMTKGVRYYKGIIVTSKM